MTITQHNPIRRLLDRIGVPWRAARGEVTRQFGTVLHPAYRTEIVPVVTNPPIAPGLLWPLSAQVFHRYASDLPITRFSAVASYGRTARENLGLTVEHFARCLGPARPAVAGSAIQCRWSAGAARIVLTAYPRDLDPGIPSYNPAHERDSRLIEACHIAVATGFRPPLAEAEWHQLDSFVPLGITWVVPAATLERIDATPAEESELEFAREPPAGIGPLLGHFGHSADRSALIACHDQLFMLGASAIAGFVVDRSRAAKGPGGSALHVVCPARGGLGPTKRVCIARRPDPDDLNALAGTMGTVFTKPVELGAYVDDD